MIVHGIPGPYTAGRRRHPLARRRRDVPRLRRRLRRHGPGRRGRGRSAAAARGLPGAAVAGDRAVRGRATASPTSATPADVRRGGGFGVVRQLVGHGVGRRMHEDPQIPNYGPPGRGPELQEGMVFAIEPMITAGSHDIHLDDDGWSIFTTDGSMAAHFEHTVAITADGPQILTLGPDGTRSCTAPHRPIASFSAAGASSATRGYTALPRVRSAGRPARLRSHALVECADREAAVAGVCTRPYTTAPRLRTTFDAGPSRPARGIREGSSQRQADVRQVPDHPARRRRAS